MMRKVAIPLIGKGTCHSSVLELQKYEEEDSNATNTVNPKMDTKNQDERKSLGSAEQMYQQGLAEKEKALGPEHASTLDTVNSLGSLYRDQGKLRAAEQMYDRAKDIATVALDRPLAYPELKELRQIRLLQVSGEQGSGRMLGKFTVVSLDSLPVEYKAVSYSWGYPQSTEEVWFGKHKFLKVNPAAASMLRSVIALRDPSYLWVDALCIDQNNLPEKGLQVRLMRDVFRSAKQVVVWLGDPSADSSLAMEFIVTLMHAIQTLYRTGQPVTVESVTQSESCEHPSFRWEALNNLLERPLFERVWVIQELVVASDAMMICGPATVNWSFLAVVVTIMSAKGLQKLLRLRPDGDIPVGANGEMGVVATFGIKSRRNAGTKVTLQYNLLNCYQYKSTDPRDKVYALLGMSDDAADEELDPKYDAPAEVCFANISRHIMARDSSLGLLHAAGTGLPRSMPDLPSWAPDWSCVPQTTILGAIAETTGYRSSGTTTAKVNAGTDPRLLHVIGIIIDTVKEVFRVRIQQPWLNDSDRLNRIRAQQLNWFHESAALITSLAPYPTGEPIDDVYWRTLTANISHSDGLGRPAPAEDARHFRSYLNLLRLSQNSQSAYDIQGTTAEIERESERFTASISAVGNRKLFTTSRGYTGLGPPELCIGDSLCIFYGAATPFLIRPSAKSSDARSTHALVGECYVHGMMNGQGLSMGEPQEVVLS